MIRNVKNQIVIFISVYDTFKKENSICYNHKVDKDG